jgi:hypothetical protein
MILALSNSSLAVAQPSSSKRLEKPSLPKFPQGFLVIQIALPPTMLLNVVVPNASLPLPEL